MAVKLETFCNIMLNECQENKNFISEVASTEFQI
jgi:hypothetical protein